MQTFLWEFFYDSMILKSPPVHYSTKYIIAISTGGLPNISPAFLVKIFS